ncbi:MAG: hypothetical protein AAE986_04115 [Thermoplasmataceae archaeon]|jgi:hypothetical protein
MIKTPKRFGSFMGGVVTAIILIPLLVMVSVYAVIFAGLIAALVSRGVTRGVLSTVLAGFILVAVIIIVAVLNLNTYMFSMLGDISTFSILRNADIQILTLVNLGTLTLVEKTLFYLVLLPGLGGLIGGLVRPGY